MKISNLFKTSVVLFASMALLSSCGEGGSGSEHTVTFMTDSTVYKTETVADGETVTKPTDPTKTGYTFDAWYSDSAKVTKFDFSTKITTDWTLYAKFVASQTPSDTTTTSEDTVEPSTSETPTTTYSLAVYLQCAESGTNPGQPWWLDNSPTTYAYLYNGDDAASATTSKILVAEYVEFYDDSLDSKWNVTMDIVYEHVILFRVDSSKSALTTYSELDAEKWNITNAGDVLEHTVYDEETGLSTPDGTYYSNVNAQ